MLSSFILPTFAGRGNVYVANAVVTAPVIYSTAAGTGGPLLYNGSSSASGNTKGVTAYVIAASFGLSVASTVAGALGLTGGPTTAPTSTTAITSVQNLELVSGATPPQCSVYNVGTVSAAGTFFLPFGHVHTGAITVDTDDDNFIHLGGLCRVSPGYFAAVSASATLTTAVLSIGLVWVEIQND